MIDIHPPHHAASTWRDFLIHIATIVVGLLIAIGLEQGVEAIHHRNLAREARENIRHEIEENHKQALENEGYVKSDLDRIDANLSLAVKLRTNPQALDGQSMRFTIDWSSFTESAWRSSRDSGALTFMPTAEVQQFDDAYLQQDFVNKQAIEIFTLQSEASAPLYIQDQNASLTQDERNALAREIAIVRVRLLLLQQTVAELDQTYQATLRK